MQPYIVFLLALCGHAIGDYVLQTDFIAKAKSPKFWENKDNTSWAFVMIAHCLIWAMCVFLPFALAKGFASLDQTFALVFSVNVVIHFFVDWLKCIGKTNLLEDQCIHYAQIIVSMIILYSIH